MLITNIVIPDQVNASEKQVLLQQSQKGTTGVPTEEETYKKLIALKTKYPEGISWMIDNQYAWKGGIYTGGIGCAGLAFRLSDEAFGNLPARMIKSQKEIIRIHSLGQDVNKR